MWKYAHYESGLDDFGDRPAYRLRPQDRPGLSDRAATTWPTSRPAPSLIDPFVQYCRLRLAEDPVLWAHTLFDEIVELGFAGSYPTLTGAIRGLGLRSRVPPVSTSARRYAPSRACVPTVWIAR